MDKGFSLEDIEFRTDLPTTNEEDYQKILALGERVEKATRTCKLDEFLQDIKPFLEDLKIAKGLMFKFIFPKNIDDEVREKYILELTSYVKIDCMSIIDLSYSDLEDDKLSYEMTITGLPLRN